MKRILLIMRHAKSDWHTGAGRDFDRPLNARGIRDAEKMGQWLRSEGYTPDVIVSSPAVRAKQTIKRVCHELGIDEQKIVWDKNVYEAHLDNLLEVLETHADDARCLLLVGHNPGLDALVSYLARDELLLSESGKLMTTAAVAILDCGKAPITARQAATGIIRIARPKEL